MAKPKAALTKQIYATAALGGVITFAALMADRQFGFSPLDGAMNAALIGMSGFLLASLIMRFIFGPIAKSTMVQGHIDQ